MDKNIAALLRADAKTVGVKFQAQDDGVTANRKTYTYVTDIQFEEGDRAVVMVGEVLKVVEVVRVDADLEIEPNSDVQYKWIVCKVDRAGFDANLEKNREIERTLAVAYRNNMRHSYTAQILAGVDDAQRQQLTALLGKQ